MPTKLAFARHPLKQRKAGWRSITEFARQPRAASIVSASLCSIWRGLRFVCNEATRGCLAQRPRMNVVGMSMMWFFRADRQSATTGTPSIFITVQAIPAWHWQRAASELVSCGLTRIPVQEIEAVLSAIGSPHREEHRYEYFRSSRAPSYSANSQQQTVPTLQFD